MLNQVEQIRTKFVDALRDSDRQSSEVRIESFLTDVDVTEQADAFRTLITEDLAFRRIRGNPIDLDSLLRRFPQYTQIIEQVYSSSGFAESTIEFNPNDTTRIGSVVFPGGMNRLGRYHLQQLAGRGGFGEVWRAFDPELQRTVAIKVPRSDRSFTAEQIDRFLTEARCVAKLKIAGVVAVYDVGREGTFHYIVSDFIEGETLGDRITRMVFTPREAARLIADVAEILHRAHLRDLVHRDIKPSNILLDHDSRAYVTDFGLAVSEADQIHESGVVLGTFAYMSPEQAGGRSNSVDGRSDIYSMGVVLYQLLTRRLPFLAKTSTEYLNQVVSRDARPLRTIDDTIPIELERICLKCLNRSVPERYSTAKDVATELRNWIHTQSVASPFGLMLRGAAVVGAVVIVLALGVMIYSNMNREPQSVEENKAPLPVAAGPEKVEQQASVERPVSSRPFFESPGSDEFGLSRETLALERAWRDQLGQLPKELIWPNYKPGGVNGFRTDLSAYEVISDPVRLIEFGKLNGEHVRVGVSIEQPVWNGGAGIFMGYHHLDTPEGQVAQMQLFWGCRHSNSDGSYVFRITRWITQILPPQYTPLPIKELGYTDVNFPRDSTAIRMEIECRNGRFVEGSWNREPLNFHIEAQNGRTLPEDYIGVWGVYASRGTTFFRTPSVQIIGGPKK